MIEDEATIDAKNSSPINIRLANKQLIESYAELCDSLGYKRSNVIKRKNSGYGKNSNIFKFGIKSDGIRELNKDYNTCLEKFGYLGGLWKKNYAFKMRAIKANNKKALKDKKGRQITNEILKILFLHDSLRINNICNLIQTKDYNRIYGKIRYIHKKGKIIRVSYGKYALVKDF